MLCDFFFFLSVQLLWEYVAATADCFGYILTNFSTSYVAVSYI